jgi:hypothetical protein
MAQVYQPPPVKSNHLPALVHCLTDCCIGILNFNLLNY